MAVMKKVNPKNNKALKRYIETGNASQVGNEIFPLLSVGNRAVNVSRILKSGNIQLLLREELSKRGMDIGAIADKLVELSNAKRVVTASYQGNIIDEREYDDGHLQKEVIELVCKLTGILGKEIPNSESLDKNNIDFGNMSKDDLQKFVDIGNMVTVDIEEVENAG